MVSKDQSYLSLINFEKEQKIMDKQSKKSVTIFVHFPSVVKGSDTFLSHFPIFQTVSFILRIKQQKVDSLEKVYNKKSPDYLYYPL